MCATCCLDAALQVLSVQTALSIQSHPDKKLAEKLHSQQPKVCGVAGRQPQQQQRGQGCQQQRSAQAVRLVANCVRGQETEVAMAVAEQQLHSHGRRPGSRQPCYCRHS